MAVLRWAAERFCVELLDELEARCVELVMDGEPVDAPGCRGGIVQAG